jgi:hypothetical protein
MEQKNKEIYYKLMTDCKSLINCPNEKAGKRVLACEYCRFEYLRKYIAKEVYNLMAGEFEIYIPSEIAKEIYDKL